MDKIIGLLLFASVAGVHAATPTCLRLDWNYDPAILLGSFFVYVSPTSGVYPIVPGTPLDSRPRVIIDAYPSLVLTVSCAALKLHSPGPWYLVVTAVSVDMTQESAPSHELMIDGPDGPPPYVPPPPTPPPPVTLPPPLPWPTRPVSPVPPGPSAGGGGLTDTDVWRGVGATPAPPLRRDVPGAPPHTGSHRLTDSPTWKGHP